MGLDMYLHKKTYVHGGDATVEYDDWSATHQTKTFKNVSYIIQSVGYWRKANAIHQWFVNNVQDGKDDCGKYEVGKDDFKSLLEACKNALQYKERALELLSRIDSYHSSASFGENDSDTFGPYAPGTDEYEDICKKLGEILPTQSGFFFGSVEYDKWYFENLEQTINIIEKIFEDDPEFYEEYYYRSSW